MTTAPTLTPIRETGQRLYLDGTEQLWAKCDFGHIHPTGWTIVRMNAADWLICQQIAKKEQQWSRGWPPMLTFALMFLFFFIAGVTAMSIRSITEIRETPTAIIALIVTSTALAALCFYILLWLLPRREAWWHGRRAAVVASYGANLVLDQNAFIGTPGDRLVRQRKEPGYIVLSTEIGS